MTSLALERSEIAVDDPELARYALTHWQDEFDVVAGVTARAHSFPIDRQAAQPRPGSPDWQLARDRFAPGFTSIVVGAQVHGTRLGTHADPSPGLYVLPALDGHVATTPGLLLTVTLADCIPVYLLHPASGTLALLHAGWRGTAAGILELGVERLCALGGASPKEVVAHCGVGICGACYEVGSEVVRAVTGHTDGEAGRLDLRQELAQRAVRGGLARVTVSAWCTAHDHDRFHSHRRSGGGPGRMIAYLGRPVT